MANASPTSRFAAAADEVIGVYEVSRLNREIRFEASGSSTRGPASLEGQQYSSTSGSGARAIATNVDLDGSNHYRCIERGTLASPYLDTER